MVLNEITIEALEEKKIEGTPILKLAMVYKRL